MSRLLKRFLRFTEAQDLVEYALLAGLISLCALAATLALGVNVQGVYANVEAAVDGSSSPGSGNPGNGNPGNGNPGNGNPGNGNPGNGNPGNGGGGKK